MRYQVIVGNVGTVYDGDDKAEARATYERYVTISEYGVGRAGSEPVTLMEDGEPMEEFYILEG